VRCNGCSDVFESEGIEPACFEGPCPTGVDRLPPEVLRAFGLRNMLTALADTGLAPMICKEYGITREDLELFIVIAREEAELQQETNEAERTQKQR
jgi:hypothetical protein